MRFRPISIPGFLGRHLYTGRPQEEHGVRFLEQPPETVSGPRLWEIAADAGKSIGVFGSIMSWPPRTDIDGFWVPSTFSPDTQTYPPELEPIQELNLTYTRAHSPTAKKASSFPVALSDAITAAGTSPHNACRNRDVHGSFAC